MKEIPSEETELIIPCNNCDPEKPDSSCQLCNGTGRQKIQGIIFKENLKIGDQFDIVIKYRQKIRYLKNILIIIVGLSVMSSIATIYSIPNFSITYLALFLSIISTFSAIVGLIISPDPDMVETIKVPISKSKGIPFFQKK